MRARLFAVVLTLISGTTAFAHEGHGHTDPATPTHYVFEPVHAPQLIGVVVIGVLAAALGWRLMHRRSR